LFGRGFDGLDFGPALALGEFAGGEAPDDEFFSGEVVFAAGEAAAGGGGSGAHHSDDIHRKAELVAELVRQASSGRVHFAAGVEDEIVTVAQQNDRAVSGIRDAGGAGHARFGDGSRGEGFGGGFRGGKVSANLQGRVLRLGGEAGVVFGPGCGGHGGRDFLRGETDAFRRPVGVRAAMGIDSLGAGFQEILGEVQNLDALRFEHLHKFGIVFRQPGGGGWRGWEFGEELIGVDRRFRRHGDQEKVDACGVELGFEIKDRWERVGGFGGRR